MLKSGKWGGLVLICAVLFSLTACGYQNPYLAAQRELEGEGGTIPLYTALWENRTNELGLQLVFYNALNNWLLNSRRIQVKEEASEAKYTLTGEILSLEEGVTRGTVRLTVGYLLRERQTGRIVWQVARQTFSENFHLTDNPVQTRDDKRRALEEIADDLAESIYLRILQSKDL